MVRKNTYIMRRLVWTTAISVSFLPFSALLYHHASADNTTFEVNVKESLTVSVTTPETWVSGNVNEFLRNTVGIAVSSNNANGFTASMTTGKNEPNLENTAAASSSTISTINESVAKSAFPSSGWGYSLEGQTGADTSEGIDSGIYNPMVGLGATTPTTIMTSANGSSGSQNIFFGAKADYSKDSGTYVGTVVISVVTGTINQGTNPTIPTNPDTPGDDIPNDNTATYTGSGNMGTGSSGNNGTTIYTTTSTASSTATTTTTTTISEGDTRSSYTNPAGVTTVNEGTPLATGLAATSAVAAATGIVFFIVAKRRKDEEDEEEY